MMFRITEIYLDKKIAKLSLEGKIVKYCIPDLKKLLLRYRDIENKSVVLDFAGVTFIDNTAVRMLEKIKDDRIKITNCSLFIHSLLRNLVCSNEE
ncbi:MAG: STAS domain-containing protein [Thermodesulfobacteriota bacterium]